jgi:hypothetical protein
MFMYNTHSVFIIAIAIISMRFSSREYGNVKMFNREARIRKASAN